MTVGSDEGHTLAELPAFTVTGAEIRVLASVANSTVGRIEHTEPAIVEGLITRALLAYDEGGAVCLPQGPIGGAIEIMARSHLQLQVQHVGATDEASHRSWFALTPIVAIELREREEAWRVEAFPTRDVLFRISRAVGLIARPPVTVEPFLASGAMLEQCADRLALGDRDGAETALSGPDATAVAIRSFLRALDARVTTNAVVRASPTLSADSRSEVFSWIDAVDWGLWKVPMPDPSAAGPDAIGPLTAFSVCVGLAQMFPIEDDPGWRAIALPFTPATPAVSTTGPSPDTEARRPHAPITTPDAPKAPHSARETTVNSASP